MPRFSTDIIDLNWAATHPNPDIAAIAIGQLPGHRAAWTGAASVISKCDGLTLRKGLHRHSRSNLLQIAHDNLIAFADTFHNRHKSAV
jgi:hypothetical protein